MSSRNFNGSSTVNRSRLRLAVQCVRWPLRGAFSRSGLVRKLSLIAALCALCIVFYYHHITSAPATGKITNFGNGNFLVAVSSLQSFTELSRQYSDTTTPSRDTQKTNHSSFRTPTILTTSAATLASTQLSQVSTKHPTMPAASESLTKGEKLTHRTSPDGKSKAVKWREKTKHFAKTSQLPHVLLLYGTESYRPSIEVKIFLESYRIPYHITSLAKGRQFITEKSLPVSSSSSQQLQDLSILIIVSYFDISLVEPYLAICQARHLSLIWAVLPDIHSPQNPKQHFSHISSTSVRSKSIVGVTFSSTYPFYYGRPGATGRDINDGRNWTVFSLGVSGDSNMTTSDGHVTDHMTKPEGHVTNSAPLPLENINTPNILDTMGDNNTTKSATQGYRVLVEVRVKDRETKGYTDAPVVLEDMGERDGVRKIVLGTPLRYWLTHLMLLEGVHQLSQGRLVREGRERMVMVDIDDVFLAPEGRRMKVEDVEALLQAQAELRQMVPGFTFNAGFVGGYYNSGAIIEERLGNQELVRNADQLWWFAHTYRHQQPHMITPAKLQTSMENNKQFAKDHGIPASVHHYSVAPHHSGVYPVYPPLYDSWRQIWNISVTSTEEYPDLRPDHRRKGFKHRGISVLPRQTCRLFTRTFLFSHFPGGRDQLISFATGGEVFLTLLRNPVSIFMTHTPNYCCDRLGLTLFPALFQFIMHWTQLHLTYPGPLAMADRYFSLYPEDQIPVWSSPCSNQRHRDIWPTSYNCSRLPSLLILGPQKSGTTALHTFLSLHPQMKANRQTELHFEEVQFFSDENLYQRGILWYMDQFPNPELPSPSTNSSLPPSPPPPPTLLFEKSATYFTHPQAPQRAKTLLPKAQLVVILADPSRRAYSWYQHQRAHSDPTALKYSFSEVLKASSSSPPSPPPHLSSLSHHCLSPGHYYQHISHWLRYFDQSQLLLIDGDELVERPAVIMDQLLEFLGLPLHPYQSILQYDSRKGFYCVINHGKKRCLGKSKGRSYPPMTSEDQQWLSVYYDPINLQLKELLSRLGRTPPRWLITPSPPH